jgi:hypothetical protein
VVTRSRVRPRTYDPYELSLQRIERLFGVDPLRVNSTGTGSPAPLSWWRLVPPA